ncbi:MAG: biotin--[acetyl-CoA-carboxylase] ligase [Pseudomonadota bacterium]|nr:biotin--[acetyl-CoA-carboxylase] ligase [Pseudomonadota bacterium]
MLALAASGAAEGLWLRAERQVSGRGRQGRAWVSPIGNLSATTLVKLRPTDPPAATLALVAAVATEEAVSVYLPRDGRKVVIKWPNDLLIDGAKVAGILLERADNAVVIGIGVNLVHHPEGLDRPTTSLAAHGVTPDAAQFIETLAESFARWLTRWRGEGITPVRSRWLARAHPVGTALTAAFPDGSVVDGLFQGLDADGALVLRLADGGTRVIHAADIFLI